MGMTAICRVGNELMANSVRDMLAQYGIAANVERFHGEFARHSNLPGSLHWGEWGQVLVPGEQAAAATQLAQEFLAALTAGPVSDAELERQALAAAEPEQEP